MAREDLSQSAANTDADDNLEISKATWTVDPRVPGYLPIAGAAIWIATKGLRDEIDPYDEPQMSAALKDLVDQIASGHVSVVGIRDGKPEIVPAHLFVCPIAFLPSAQGESLVSSHNMVLRTWAYDNDRTWEEGFDDSLADVAQTYWAQLRVKCSDVATLWPFDEIRRAEALRLTRTGGQGRPSAMHLINVEHERRLASGEACERVFEEARHLASWFALAYRDLPPTSAKTIENRIRVKHRKHKSPRK